MTLKSPLTVAFERQTLALVETMSEMRSWLDQQKIQPVEFRTARVDGGFRLRFELHFAQEDEAVLFERRFKDLGAPNGG